MEDSALNLGGIIIFLMGRKQKEYAIFLQQEICIAEKFIMNFMIGRIHL
jgi:hypothetical protein